MQRFFPTAILVLILSSCQSVPSQISTSQATSSDVIASTSTSVPAAVQGSPEAGNDQRQEMDIPQELRKANDLIVQGDYQAAILILNDVIAIAPDNLDAFGLRAAAYSRSSSNNYETQVGNYVSALQDMDKIITLEPTNGNHYVNREYTLRTLANLPPDRATRFALYELSNESVDKAILLGVTPDFDYVYRHHARNLIESNHCQEGLDETRALVDKTSAEDPIMETYNIYFAEAYLCLGDMDKALEAIQKMQCSEVNCKGALLAAVYYQTGDLENALKVLNDSIDSEPTFNGWRYLLRALIYYDQGEKEQAMQDLETGKRYTWFVNGPGWYVSARLAFDDGDDTTGLLYLQNAESVMDITFEPLRQKILAEIQEHGGEPLNLSPQIPTGVNPTPR